MKYYSVLKCASWAGLLTSCSLGEKTTFQLRWKYRCKENMSVQNKSLCIMSRQMVLRRILSNGDDRQADRLAQTLPLRRPGERPGQFLSLSVPPLSHCLSACLALTPHVSLSLSHLSLSLSHLSLTLTPSPSLAPEGAKPCRLKKVLFQELKQNNTERVPLEQQKWLYGLKY